MSSKRLIRISYFTMLTIVGGLIKFPVPGVGTVHFTFQTLFVIMSGLVLGAKDGAFAMLAYMVLGLIGLPIFTNGGGIGYVIQPSFGYIVAFIFGSFLAGILKARSKTMSVLKLFFCGFCGLLLIYAVGMVYQFLMVWLVLKAGLYAAALSLVTLPLMFIIDSILIYLACLIYPRIITMIGIEESRFIKKEKKETEIATIK